MALASGVTTGTAAPTISRTNAPLVQLVERPQPAIHTLPEGSTAMPRGTGEAIVTA